MRGRAARLGQPSIQRRQVCDVAPWAILSRAWHLWPDHPASDQRKAWNLLTCMSNIPNLEHPMSKYEATRHYGKWRDVVAVACAWHNLSWCNACGATGMRPPSRSPCGTSTNC